MKLELTNSIQSNLVYHETKLLLNPDGAGLETIQKLQM